MKAKFELGQKVRWFNDGVIRTGTIGNIYLDIRTRDAPPEIKYHMPDVNVTVWESSLEDDRELAIINREIEKLFDKIADIFQYKRSIQEGKRHA